MNLQGAYAPPLTTVDDDAGADFGSGGDDLGSRGHTVLANRVIEKIAGQVASDETSAGGSSGGFLGIGAHADLSARPKASVELSGNIATVSVEVGLLYPTPLRQATEDLRQRIRGRVTELTGVEVRQVDIKVAWLTTEGAAPGRRRLL
ncbi:Asp23/Gls24 family envelope stress response protein [Arthrobacter sp. H14-L1]|uniref:Asp23/Gls24 family envelope stress response protein n=1 Tax=Arthrobacter sp. H14-L1 TaxID=2996697 RepID=UPI0022719A10|nr:Asp23/Gls24 family envelope stress response protein [Arthrobacter sp. H14-L1]MCY0905321.1 Asp23/Gls24 family envelope stress response protein [Arthrobacter sp. H14-L1]